jgi:membrane protease subunit HflK
MSIQNQPPSWAKKKGPPSLEELIAALLKKIKDSFEGRGQENGPLRGEPEPSSPSLGSVLPKVLTVVGILLLFNIVTGSFYTIEPGERGVILRLGKFQTLTNPGLNFKVPMLDTLTKVDVETVRKQEFGFRTVTPGQKTVYEKNGYGAESLILTGDKNVIDVEWIVQYKVNDPVNYLFKVRNTEQAVRDVSEKSIRRVMGNQDFDFALQNREIIEMSMAKDLQATLDTYESGIKIVTVKLQDVNPPNAVKPAFNEVNEADQDMKRLVNEAEENYNRVIPKAKGSAKQILEEAHGYAVERVNLAKGEAGRFTNILAEYKVAKDVTRRRMYLETMQKVLPQVDSIYLIDKEQRSIMPFLDLGKATTAAPAKVETNK